MNTDQGSQFTSIEFIKVLTCADIRISMDGKRAWPDTVITERLRRTIKYEEVYLRAYASVPELGGALPSTTAASPIHRMAGGRAIRQISTSHSRSPWRHEQGGDPLVSQPKAVQRSRATSRRFATEKKAMTSVHAP